MSRNLKMPWSMEDTMKNMEHIRDIMIKKVQAVNLDGRAEKDVQEVNFDFNRVKKAIEKQISKKPVLEGDGYADGQLVYDTWICPCCGKGYEVEFDNYDYCPNCGQKVDLSDVN